MERKCKKINYKWDLCYEHDEQLEISHEEGLNTPGSCMDQNLEEKNENETKEV